MTLAALFSGDIASISSFAVIKFDPWPEAILLKETQRIVYQIIALTIT